MSSAPAFRPPPGAAAGPPPAGGALRIAREHTHGIAFWPEHRFVLDSSALGWREVYTSLAEEQPWQRDLPPLRHIALAYCARGAARVRRAVGGEGRALERELRPRSFGMIPHDRDCRIELDGRPQIQLVYLHRDLIDRVAAEGFERDAAAIELQFGLGVADPLLEQLCRALLAAARDPQRGAGELYADSIAHLMAAHLLRHYQPQAWARRAPKVPPTVDAHRLQRLCDWIEAHLGADLRLARLAREAGLSVHAFAPAFTRAMGMPPHAYVLQRRVAFARRQLQGTSLPLAEIALQSGFSSQSHLTSVFKRLTGQTPAALRR